MTPLTPLNTLKSLVLSSRPLSWVNTAFPFAAAYFMTARHIDVAFIVGTIFFLIPYNLAMYGINDVFDYESDLRNPRKGGVEGALLDPRVHSITLAAAVLLNLPFLIFLVMVGTPGSAIVLAVSAFAVFAYSAPRLPLGFGTLPLRFKERPFLDSLTSSIHFVSPAIFGLTLAGAQPTPALLALLGAYLLWGIASHAFGAVQDIIADREAQIASIATVIGGRRTVRLAFVAYLLAAALLVFTPFPGPLAALLMLPYAANVLPYRRITDAHAEAAHAGWRRFLLLNFATGFAVTLLLIWFALLTSACAGGNNFGWAAWVPGAMGWVHGHSLCG